MGGLRRDDIFRVSCVTFGVPGFFLGWGSVFLSVTFGREYLMKIGCLLLFVASFVSSLCLLGYHFLLHKTRDGVRESVMHSVRREAL
jgi:hypothetical protein